MGQKGLFIIIRIRWVAVQKKKKEKKKKNLRNNHKSLKNELSMNTILNLKAYNKPGWVDMPLKSI